MESMGNHKELTLVLQHNPLRGGGDKHRDTKGKGEVYCIHLPQMKYERPSQAIKNEYANEQALPITLI